MDPITIISLLGNVIQFVEFSNDLVSKSVQLYQSSNGTLAELTDTMTATNHLLGLNYKLKDAAAKTDDKALKDLCISCESTADELLMALDKVRVKNKHRKWESIRKALLTVWSRDEIAELEQRLARLRDELNMHITADLRLARNSQKIDRADNCSLSRDQVYQLKLEQSNGLRSLDLASKNIMDAIIEQRDVFFAAHDAQMTLMAGLLQEIRVRTVPGDIYHSNCV